MNWLIRVFNLLIPTIGDLITLPLIYAIWSKSTKRMEFIRPVLMKMAIADIGLSQVFGWGWYPDQYYPIIMAKLNGFFQFFGKIGAYLAFWLFILFGIGVLGAIFEGVFARLAIAYRWNWIASLYRGKNFIILQLLYLVASLLLSLGVQFLLGDSQLLTSYVIKLNMTDYITSIDLTNDVLIFINMDSNFAFPACIALLVLFIALFIGYGLTFATHRRIFSKAVSLSNEQKRLQRSLTLMFIVQTTLPAIFLLIPSFALCFSALFYQELSQIYRNKQWNPQDVGWYYIFGGYVLYAPMNSLLTLLIVKPYRDFLVSLPHHLFCRKKLTKKKAFDKQVSSIFIIKSSQ